MGTHSMWAALRGELKWKSDHTPLESRRSASAMFGSQAARGGRMWSPGSRWDGALAGPAARKQAGSGKMRVGWRAGRGVERGCGEPTAKPSPQQPASHRCSSGRDGGCVHSCFCSGSGGSGNSRVAGGSGDAGAGQADRRLGPSLPSLSDHRELTYCRGHPGLDTSHSATGSSKHATERTAAQGIHEGCGRVNACAGMAANYHKDDQRVASREGSGRQAQRRPHPAAAVLLGAAAQATRPAVTQKEHSTAQHGTTRHAAQVVVWAASPARSAL